MENIFSVCITKLFGKMISLNIAMSTEEIDKMRIKSQISKSYHKLPAE